MFLKIWLHSEYIYANYFISLPPLYPVNKRFRNGFIAIGIKSNHKEPTELPETTGRLIATLVKIVYPGISKWTNICCNFYSIKSSKTRSQTVPNGLS